MYKLVEFADVIRIPPRLFGQPLKEASLEILKESFEGRVVQGVGLVISILDAEVSEEGFLTWGDGASYHEARFTALVFSPVNNEVVEGEVDLVENIGLTVRLGPVEGFVHKSQIYPSRNITYDRENGVVIIQDEKGTRTIRKGDVVRGRVVGVSYDEQRGQLKIRLTMRQPYLGKREFIMEMIEKSKAGGQGAGKA
ncbi:DNA-directed RNA polymerase [Thermofilum pendens]|uniref:DNA-directed RNA polymerase n=1 Tax=Thermofilum pendens TaxID=2269 RepID=UPI00069B29A3|nr:DNA-directed RNA polymerase [Thermofilum pendens]